MDSKIRSNLCGFGRCRFCGGYVRWLKLGGTNSFMPLFSSAYSISRCQLDERVFDPETKEFVIVTPRIQMERDRLVYRDHGLVCSAKTRRLIAKKEREFLRNRQQVLNLIDGGDVDGKK